MPASSRLPIRQQPLRWALAFYTVCSLLSMAAMSIATGVLVLALLLSFDSLGKGTQQFQKERSSLPGKKYWVASILLLLAAAASLLAGNWFPLEYGGHHSEVHFLKDLAKCWYLFWPFLLVMGLRRLDATEKNNLLNIWIGAFGLLSILGVFQYFYGWPRPQGIPDLKGGSSHFHVTLFLGHHLSVASIFIFPFFAALDQAWFHRTHFKRAAIYAAIATIGGVALLLTYSRTLWAALPLGILAWTVLRLPRKVAIGATLSMVFIAWSLLQVPSIQDRVHDSLGIGTRQRLWLANIEFFKQRPLFGVGLKHNQELSGYYLMEQAGSKEVFSGHAHNNFLDFTGGLGAFGIITWLLWCGTVFWLALRKNASPLGMRLGVGITCAWIVFHLNGLTQVNFWEGKVQHQLAWIIAWTLL